MRKSKQRKEYKMVMSRLKYKMQKGAEEGEVVRKGGDGI